MCGSGARDAESSGPVNPSEQVINETISVVQSPVDVDVDVDVAKNAGVEEDPNQLIRKRKEVVDAAQVSDVPSAKKAATGERSSRTSEPKHWLASMPPEDRKVEMFDNYVSPRDTRTFKKETLEIFIANLVDDVTRISIYHFLLFDFSYSFQACHFAYILIHGQRACLRAGHHS